MAKITQSSDLGRIKDPKTFAANTSIVFQDIVQAVNGNLDFQTNFNCYFAEFNVDSGNVGTDIAIPHQLGKIPTGRLIYATNVNGSVFDGTAAWTAANIYMQASAVGNVKIIIF